MKSYLLKILFFALISTLFISGCSRTNQKVKVVRQASKLQTPKHNIDRFGVDAKDNTGFKKYSSVDNSDTKTHASNGKTIATIYFDFDKSYIRSDMKTLILQDAKLLNSEQMRNRKILLEGNCDELGSNIYNKTLGLKRAKSVKSALNIQGVNPERMDTISYGKSNPVCSQNTQTCRAKNRRVNIILK